MYICVCVYVCMYVCRRCVLHWSASCTGGGVSRRGQSRSVCIRACVWVGKWVGGWVGVGVQAVCLALEAECPGALRAADGRGHTCLHIACLAGHAPLARALAEAGGPDLVGFRAAVRGPARARRPRPDCSFPHHRRHHQAQCHSQCPGWIPPRRVLPGQVPAALTLARRRRRRAAGRRRWGWPRRGCRRRSSRASAPPAPRASARAGGRRARRRRSRP
jgi:hypothetical protein